MSKRQRFHITLPSGEKIWITGNTISETFANGLKKVGGGESKPLRITPSFKNYAEEWWTLYKLPKLKHTTLRTYRNLLDKHILPYMGGMSLQEMTTNSAQRFLMSMRTWRSLPCGKCAFCSMRFVRRQLKMVISPKTRLAANA